MPSPSPPPPYRQHSPLRKQAVNEAVVANLKDSESFASTYTAAKWGVGWKVPMAMAVSYITALILAFGHLGLFLYLDRRAADDDERAVPQSYVITISNIISNAFALSLKSSLAVAFTQYLWYTLRRSPLKVSTIDSLFGIRGNAFLLFDRFVLSGGPVLVVVAIMMWAMQVVASFPPGALTIASTTKVWNTTMDIPTFNASFFGNSSGFDAQRLAFFNFNKRIPCTLGELICADDFDVGSSPLLKLIPKTLINGMPDSFASPCGANCSFTLSLDAPYLDCNVTTLNVLFDDTTGPPIFEATWDNHVLNVTTYAVDISSFIYPAKAQSTVCTPARASYTLGIRYENNVQTMEVSIGAVTKLNIDSPAPLVESNTTYMEAVNFPGFMGRAHNNDGIFYGVQALNWTAPLVHWYRDLQLMTIINVMGTSLQGGVIVDPLDPDSQPSDATIVANTIFHDSFSNYVLRAPPTLASIAASKQIVQNVIEPFTVSQQLLNQALLNITMSVITDFRLWNATDTEIQQRMTINVYSFSKPLNLVIPYFVSLFLALPVLFIGGFALHQNGVSAVDGGFIQLITTSTGSATLESLAARGCLGGENGASKELKELKIRFGEFVEDGDSGVKRAGFGTFEETVPLKKGAIYGVRDYSFF